MFGKVGLMPWNMGSLTGESIELVKTLHESKITKSCVQETKEVGAKVGEINEYKLWYSGSNRSME